MNKTGFTLLELLISLLLVSLVFIGAISMYMTGLKFLKTGQIENVEQQPVIALENIAKRIPLANSVLVYDPGGPVAVNVPGNQLFLRVDYPCSPPATNAQSFISKNTPADMNDDNWWHYRFFGAALYGVCNNNGNQPYPWTGAEPVLMNNVVVANSSFMLTNPSGSGTASVVKIHVRTSPPTADLDTQAALGAQAKN